MGINLNYFFRLDKIKKNSIPLLGNIFLIMGLIFQLMSFNEPKGPLGNVDKMRLEKNATCREIASNESAYRCVFSYAEMMQFLSAKTQNFRAESFEIYTEKSRLILVLKK